MVYDSETEMNDVLGKFDEKQFCFTTAKRI